MAKIKRFITILIPNQKCNLKCEYCYISQIDAWEEPQLPQYSPEHIAACLSMERLGGPSLINLTGNGETLLQPGLVEIVTALLREGHYVEIVTNGTVTKVIEQLMCLPRELLAHLEFKMSFHFKELKRLGIMDQFFRNVQMIHRSGASFTLELMAYDGIEGDIEEIKQVCRENVGAICHATIGRDDKSKKRGLLTKHSKEEFETIWAELDSDMLRYKLELLGVKRKEFCYAGMWSLHVNLYTGETQQCYWMPCNQNIFEDPSKPINFSPVGYFCPQPFCYNGHAHMTWGLIPELNAPKYCQMRDRICENGESWLTKECQDFFSSKLAETNQEYTKFQKVRYTIREPFQLAIWFVKDKHTISRLKKLKRYFTR